MRNHPSKSSVFSKLWCVWQNKKKYYFNPNRTLATKSGYLLGHLPCLLNIHLHPHVWQEWHTNPRQSLWVHDFIVEDYKWRQHRAEQQKRSDEDGGGLVCVGALEG